MDFFSGPFESAQKYSQDIFGEGFVYDPILLPDDQPLTMMTPCTEAPPSESRSLYESALLQFLMTAMQTLATGEGSISAEEHEQLTASMHSLFTTRNIRKCVKMYFKFWHPNCQIIHPPSFNPKTAQTPLLLVVALMGALYSHHETTVHAAKKLLDVAELAVFSTGLFAPEHEMRCAYSGTEIPSDAISPLQFQEFQAAYLIVVLQYWAGNRRAKNRAMETRFSEIIKVSVRAP